MTALYCLELLLEGGELAYKDFIEAQQNLHRNDQSLSRDSFNAMSEKFKAFLANHADEPLVNRKKLLEYIVIYSDLAKTPSVKKWAEAHGIDPQLGGDEIMLKILQKPEAEILAMETLLDGMERLDFCRNSLVRENGRRLGAHKSAG